MYSSSSGISASLAILTLVTLYTLLFSTFVSIPQAQASPLLWLFKSSLMKKGGYPKFRSWKKNGSVWYSMNRIKGWGLLNNGTSISVSLGNIPGMKTEKGEGNPSVIGKLKETLTLQDNEIIKTFMLTKQQGNTFYGIFTVERCTPKRAQF